MMSRFLKNGNFDISEIAHLSDTRLKLGQVLFILCITVALSETIFKFCQFNVKFCKALLKFCKNEPCNDQVCPHPSPVVYVPFLNVIKVNLFYSHGGSLFTSIPIWYVSVVLLSFCSFKIKHLKIFNLTEKTFAFGYGQLLLKKKSSKLSLSSNFEVSLFPLEWNV